MQHMCARLTIKTRKTRAHTHTGYLYILQTFSTLKRVFGEISEKFKYNSLFYQNYDRQYKQWDLQSVEKDNASLGFYAN